MRQKLVTEGPPGWGQAGHRPRYLTRLLSPAPSLDQLYNPFISLRQIETKSNNCSPIFLQTMFCKTHSLYSVFNNHQWWHHSRMLDCVWIRFAIVMFDLDLGAVDGVTLACNSSLSRMVLRVTSLVTEGLITSLLMQSLGVICHTDRSSFSQLQDDYWCENCVYTQIQQALPKFMCVCVQLGPNELFVTSRSYPWMD